MMPLAGLCFVYAQQGESLKMSRGSLLRLTHKVTVLATVKITPALHALLTFSDGKKENAVLCIFYMSLRDKFTQTL